VVGLWQFWVEANRFGKIGNGPVEFIFVKGFHALVETGVGCLITGGFLVGTRQRHRQQ
jgi:hypothetical protein